ncbi:MAG: bifunctional metallophosphatase/5'-nucleotidase [Eubacteriaceae bacterium]|nr:bifunctional metallophosphatase/5'-nucleotidase [Eubacteriaceae bacterium]
MQKECIILNKGGVKIAVFGVIGKDAISCAPKSGLIFKDPIESAKKTVDELKQKENPDLIICLSHSGTDTDSRKSEDELLAKAAPDIDVILSGHTHTTINEPIISGSTVICSTGSYTYNVGELTLNKDSNGNYTVKDYKLIPVNGTIDNDAAVTNKISEYKNLVNKNYLSLFGFSFDQTLAVCDFLFTPIENFAKKLQEDGLGDLIADSYVYAIKNAEGANYKNVDVSVVPSGVIRSSFDKGPITVSEVYNTLSLGIGKDNIAGYPLVSIYLTGKELKAVAEVDASISAIMPDAQLYMSGLAYEYNPNRLFLNRVTDVYLIKDGQRVKIDDNKLYRVVSGLYSAQMLGAVKGKSFGLLSIIPKDEAGNAITNFEDYIVYNKNNKEQKEWVALASYIQSFSANLVPEYYNQTHERKVEVNSKNILSLIKNPNKVFFLALAAIILILLIIIFIIVKLRKAIKRKKIKSE